MASPPGPAYTGPPPPTLPGNLVPGFASTVKSLDATGVAAELKDATALTSLLEQAGFEAATQRTFVDPTSMLSRVTIRVLMFKSGQGALTYLDWFHAHASEVIGTASEGKPLAVADSPWVFIHTPGGCCPKDITLALVAWQKGSDVLTVLGSGAMADRSALSDVASRVDAAI